METKLTKFYEFSQTNSGGSFDVNDRACHRVVIEADSEQEAIDILEPIIEDQSPSCPCCGDRWSLWGEEVIMGGSEMKATAEVYTNSGDYKSNWHDLYGSFRRLEEPKVVSLNWGDVFRGEIYFETIEQYYQYIANAYGWTTPDVRIFYKDGKVTEIFSKKLTS